jgi:MFS family permease
MANPAVARGEGVGWYPWYVAVLLAIAAALAYLDRQVMGLLTELVKSDLQLTDVQVSLLQGLAFIVFYCGMAVPLGYISDRWPRRRLLSIGVFLWSIATAACGLAKSFAGLFAARVSVGIGEGALFPAAHSLLPDYFDAARLPRAFAVMSAGQYMGGGLAYAIGGLILAIVSGWDPVILPAVGHLAPWQITFIICASPGPLIALLMITLREPPRRHNAALRAGDKTEGFGRFLLDNKVFLLGVLGAPAVQGLMAHGIVSWTPSFFIRTFGWTAAQVGMVYGLIIVIFGGSGTLFAGFLTPYLNRRGVAGAPVRLVLWATLINVPCAIIYPLMKSEVGALVFLAGFSGFIGMCAGTFPAILQLATPHAYRGRIAGFYVISTTAIGAALGPIAIAMVTQFVLKDPLRLNESISIVCAVAGPVVIGLILLIYREFVRLTVTPQEIR